MKKYLLLLPFNLHASIIHLSNLPPNPAISKIFGFRTGEYHIYIYIYIYICVCVCVYTQP